MPDSYALMVLDIAVKGIQSRADLAVRGTQEDRPPSPPPGLLRRPDASHQ
jgi:hypothetical protein